MAGGGGGGVCCRSVGGCGCEMPCMRLRALLHEMQTRGFMFANLDFALVSNHAGVTRLLRLLHGYVFFCVFETQVNTNIRGREPGPPLRAVPARPVLVRIQVWRPGRALLRTSNIKHEIPGTMRRFGALGARLFIIGVDDPGAIVGYSFS